MKPNKISAILLVTVLSIGLAMGMTACTKKAKNPRTGLTESGSAGNGGKSATEGANSASETSSGGMAQTTGTAGVSGNSSASGSGSSGSGGSGSGGSASKPTGKTMKVKILWWNDTGQRAPSNAEVIYGSSVYKPKSGKSDVGVVAGLPIGPTVDLVIYPDGRSGKKMVAKVKFSAQMLANSDRDAIHVEVKDGGVRVLGNPVIDFIQSFSR